MPRAGLSTTAVVDAALAVVDEQGEAALTLAAVAQRTGVATPSLYKHVANLAELRTRVGARVLEDMAGRFAEAVMGRSGDEAVVALMTAYRAYVNTHPSRYAAMPIDPLHDPALAAAGGKLMDVVLAALRAYDLTGPDFVHAARCLRTVAHGFASLESGGGFGLPEDLDETYDRLVATLVATLRRA
jgi:AcrR family transcriptional regulator